MTQPSTTLSKRTVGIAAAVVVVAVAVGVVVAQHSKPAPTCVDPASAIAALPSGTPGHPTVWTGKGKYCTAGILITQHDVTIDGGKISDSQSTVPVHVHGTARVGLKPIIEVKDTTDVIIENTTLTGANSKGGYHSTLVGQAGVDIRSSSNVTVSNVDTTNTYGDGLTVFISGTKPQVVPTDIHVDKMTITQPGRDCVSPAAVTDSTFASITCAGTIPDSALDFESDIPGVGDNNLTFTNLVAKGGINIIEPVGTVSFATTSTTGKFKLDSIGANVSYQGSFLCARRAPGACVAVDNGTLDLNATFGYVPGTSKTSQPFTLATPPGILTGGS